jgi:hypothetical protein
VFVVRVQGVQYRKELILNFPLLFVRVQGEQHRMELILNYTLFGARVWRRGIERETDSECYGVCC